VILFFFTVNTGEEIAHKLKALDFRDHDDQISIIAVGMQADEAKLKAFAEDNNLDFHIIPDTPGTQVDKLYGPFKSLPVTFFISSQKRVYDMLTGGGSGKAALITKVAQSYLAQQNTEKAREMAELAKDEGEDALGVDETVAFTYVIEGDLDKAESMFKEAGSDEGLASVALERGDLDGAVAFANESDSSYAATVKGKALLRQGKLEEATQAFDEALDKPAAQFWQGSEALTGRGRVNQAAGDAEAAVEAYQQAYNLNTYNVAAMTNEAAVYREGGDIDKAADVLAKAHTRGMNDDLLTMMIGQVLEEQKKQNDAATKERIRQRVATLIDRKKAQDAGEAVTPADAWTTPPLVVAFLPAENGTPVFFERAGTELSLRRGLEDRFSALDSVQVVEREMLDALLQELELGSSDLADKNTQLELGRLLAARLLGFVEFSQTGGDVSMYVRFVDVETTALKASVAKSVSRAESYDALLDEVTGALSESVDARRALQGLIAEASAVDGIIINLGSGHGVEVGHEFTVLEEGEPIEVSGRKLGNKLTKVATIRVTDVQDEYAVCEIVQKQDNVTLAKEMKIKQAE
ncbi:MAG: hypothetical protein KJ052_04180, partial [Candidatus Hydrogenedentes bacterium]|nr:hypothetical protein [Candidatus Hydrogenedentota bacterium]